MAGELLDQVNELVELASAVAIVGRQVIESAIDQFRKATVDQHAEVVRIGIEVCLAKRQPRTVEGALKHLHAVGMSRRGPGEARPAAVVRRNRASGS